MFPLIIHEHDAKVFLKRLCIIIGLLIGCLKLTAQNLDDLSFGTENTLDILTWNIENFPKNDQVTVNYVKDIIEALDVDLLAIQEVENVNQFEQMINELGAYDGYLESIWFAGLAYIYKPDIIQINSIYEIYTTSNFWSFFPRSPMVMDFNYLNQRFIVINNHYKCCGDGFLDLNDMNDEETRRYFANLLLKEYIDTYFPDDNVILLGDLNDSLSDTPQNNTFQLFFDDSTNYLFADYQIALGTSNDWSFPNWPSHLDHILITNELFDEFNNLSSEIQTIKIEQYLSGGWPEYDTNISDHRPVALKLTIEDNLDLSTFTKDETAFVNYPNPFSLETQFSFKASTEQREIQIFNLSGQKITTLKIPNGASSLIFNSQTLSQGIYIAKLVSNNKDIATKKLVLID